MSTRPPLYTCECDSQTVCHDNRWSSADCPWAVPSQGEPPNGARAGGQATVRGCRPLLPLLPLGALSAKNKLSENHIFFSGLKVKNATFPPSGKRSACQLRAHLLDPSSHLERPEGRGREEGRGGGKQRREVGRKGQLLWTWGSWVCGNQWACLCWSSSRPERG